MSFKSCWTFAFLIFAICRCSADDDHEMEEFLKREYSLSKPYQGNAISPVIYPQWCSRGQAEGQMFPEEHMTQITTSVSICSSFA